MSLRPRPRRASVCRTVRQSAITANAATVQKTRTTATSTQGMVTLYQSQRMAIVAIAHVAAKACCVSGAGSVWAGHPWPLGRDLLRCAPWTKNPWTRTKVGQLSLIQPAKRTPSGAAGPAPHARRPRSTEGDTARALVRAMPFRPRDAARHEVTRRPAGPLPPRDHPRHEAVDCFSEAAL